MADETGAPVRSMTGFGGAEREARGARVRVEIRSVNHRHLKLSTRLPAILESRSPLLEAPVRRRLARGSVSLGVWLRRDPKVAPGRIVPAVLEDYANQVQQIAERLGEVTRPPLEALLRLPGVVAEAPPEQLSDDDVHLVVDAIDAAVAELVGMRENEGAALATEIASHLDEIDRVATQVEARVPQAVLEQRDRLRQRIEALVEEAVPEELLAREAAVLADRTDVAEEVARLRSHTAQTREALAKGGPVGRRLDFLAQELSREANTIGSKSQDQAVTRAAVDLKLAVEKLREQAANLE